MHHSAAMWPAVSRQKPVSKRDLFPTYLELSALIRASAKLAEEAMRGLMVGNVQMQPASTIQRGG